MITCIYDASIQTVCCIWIFNQKKKCGTSWVSFFFK